MLPIPARSAVLAFYAGAAILSCGVLASSPTATSLGGGVLLGLATAFAFTVPIGARLRSQRIELAWWLGHDESAQGTTGVVTSVPFELRCYVRNAGRQGLRFTELLPVVPNGVRVLEGLGAELELPPRTRTEVRFRLIAVAPGRVVVQGLGVAVPGPLGLFSAPLYFPSPLTVKVLPRASSRAAAGARLGSGEAVERAGLTPLRRRGAGTELHEIREHRPGDAFKSIAWKPSARAGKLLVREVEREVQDTLELVLDVSGSMRGGAPGERKLDHCIEVAAVLARAALERGDRVGLVTADGRVISQVGDAEGVRHMLRIYDALLHATEIVDADLTHADDAEVTATVGLYLRQQEGVELLADGAWDVAALAAHAARALQTEPDQVQVVASSPEHALLRRFCRMRGIALPYRAETRGLAKASGLAQALRKAAGQGRSPRTLLLITDLDAISDLEPLMQEIKLLSARQHRVALIVPDAATLMPPAQTELERELRRVYAMQEARRLREARKLLGAMGIPLLGYDARLGEGGLLRNAAALRRVA